MKDVPISKLFSRNVLLEVQALPHMPYLKDCVEGRLHLLNPPRRESPRSLYWQKPRMQK
jgi:hypothetical protein